MLNSKQPKCFVGIPSATSRSFLIPLPPKCLSPRTSIPPYCHDFLMLTAQKHWTRSERDTVCLVGYRHRLPLVPSNASQRSEKEKKNKCIKTN